MTQTTNRTNPINDSLGDKTHSYRVDYDSSITTTNSYVRALTIDTRSIKRGILNIVNTHASNQLYYEVRGSLKDSTTMPDTTDNSWVVIKKDVKAYNVGSTNGDSGKIETFDNTYNFLEILVKAVSSGNQATCEIYSKSMYE